MTSDHPPVALHLTRASDTEARPNRERETDATTNDAPIIHEQGCGWETGPYCTCGADPDRASDWFFGAEAACKYLASVSWPWEREENRDTWAVTMLHRPDLLANEIERARERLESAIAYLTAQTQADAEPTQPTPANPTAGGDDTSPDQPVRITFITWDADTDGVAVLHNDEPVWAERTFDRLDQYLKNIAPLGRPVVINHAERDGASSPTTPEDGTHDR